jgi:S-adenosylmethionine hydrolase
LITDFGTRDPYAGIMKGVILTISPSAKIVDITHEIEPQNIEEASRVLKESSSYFPEDTIFLVVVDPGVGTNRKPVAISAGRRFVVCPDNGVITRLIETVRADGVIVLDQKAYHLKEHGSSTFHGRDIFAPVAGHMSAGAPFHSLGTRMDRNKLTLLPSSPWNVTESVAVGTVAGVDRFGNILSNIPSDRFVAASDQLNLVVVRVGSSPPREAQLTSTYGMVETDTLCVVPNSAGMLEIAVNCGNAAQEISAKTGMPIAIIRIQSGQHKIQPGCL